MTANGAKENTLQQMEDTFGLSTEELNQLLNLYLRNLPHVDKLKVSMANSIWFREEGKNPCSAAVSSNQRQLLWCKNLQVFLQFSYTECQQ